MASPAQGRDSVSAGPYRFGPFVLDMRAGTLTRDGTPVRLPPKPFTLLGCLVERADALVTRDELRTALWGDGTFVDAEEGLAFCLRQVRQALGDRPTSSTYIETVRGRGLRFVHPVVDLSNARHRRRTDPPLAGDAAPVEPFAPAEAMGPNTGAAPRLLEARSGRDRRQGDRRGAASRRSYGLVVVVGFALLVVVAVLASLYGCPARASARSPDQAGAASKSTAI